jgi:hypothetical protein
MSKNPVCIINNMMLLSLLLVVLSSFEIGVQAESLTSTSKNALARPSAENSLFKRGFLPNFSIKPNFDLNLKSLPLLSKCDSQFPFKLAAGGAAAALGF